MAVVLGRWQPVSDVQTTDTNVIVLHDQGGGSVWSFCVVLLMRAARHHTYTYSIEHTPLLEMHADQKIVW